MTRGSRRLFRLTALIMAVIMMIVFYPIAGKAEPVAAELKIRADAAIVVDADTGQVFYGKNAGNRMHPASLTKIMTGIIALERGDLNQEVVITKKAGWTDIGSSIFLRPGDKLTLENLLKASLILSANDAAVAVAEAVGGTERHFAELMNHKAYLLGARSTNFVNANGYSKPNHYTTAADLALITRYALGIPRFAEIVKTRHDTIRWNNREKEMEVTNTNRLLDMYEGCYGVKTGTTRAAGGCLVAAAERDGRRSIAVVLNSSSRYSDAAKLLDYAFNNFTQVKFTKGQAVAEAAVTGGYAPKVPLLAAEDVSLTVAKNEAGQVEVKKILAESYRAPIEAGQPLGELVIFFNGTEVKRTALIAANEVQAKSLWAKFMDLFKS